MACRVAFAFLALILSSACAGCADTTNDDDATSSEESLQSTPSTLEQQGFVLARTDVFVRDVDLPDTASGMTCVQGPNGQICYSVFRDGGTASVRTGARRYEHPDGRIADLSHESGEGLLVGPILPGTYELWGDFLQVAGATSFNSTFVRPIASLRVQVQAKDLALTRSGIVELVMAERRYDVSRDLQKLDPWTPWCEGRSQSTDGRRFEALELEAGTNSGHFVRYHSTHPLMPGFDATVPLYPKTAARVQPGGSLTLVKDWVPFSIRGSLRPDRTLRPPSGALPSAENQHTTPELPPGRYLVQPNTYEPLMTVQAEGQMRTCTVVGAGTGSSGLEACVVILDRAARIGIKMRAIRETNYKVSVRLLP